MASPSSAVITTKTIDDDFFLCRAFANAISSDKLLQIIEQQPISVPSKPKILHDENVQMIEKSSLSSSENTKWKVGDLCLCPFSEDGLLYKATINDLVSSSYTVLFDDYGNEEIHPLTDLQIRIEEQQQQESILSVDETDELPQPAPSPLPPFPVLNSNGDKDSLSATLMSWYLAGYHTGFYQGIKDKK